MNKKDRTALCRYLRRKFPGELIHVYAGRGKGFWIRVQNDAIACEVQAQASRWFERGGGAVAWGKHSKVR